MSRGTCLRGGAVQLALGAALAALASSPSAHAQDEQAQTLPQQDQTQHKPRNHVTPYIEVGQVLSADVTGGGDILTYSTVSAGIDASVHTRRVEVQVSYKYSRVFAEKGNAEDTNLHQGLARIAAKVAPGLTVEAGGIATRARVDSRGAVTGNTTANAANVSQVYSGYIGPNFTAHTGPINFNAAYRFGYTRAENPTPSGVSSTAPKLDLFDESKDQVASASISTKSGTLLPVGLTLSAGWEHEDAGQLDQKYDDKAARGDVVLPVGGGLAFEAGAGYEKVHITQRDPKLDSTGHAITDSAGHFVTDPSSPERTAFASDGLIWDAGVVYRPNHRTELEARVGKRYGSMSYTGALQMQLSAGSAVQVGVYDSVSSFGRQLTGSVAMLPTSFSTPVDPFGDQFNNCVFSSGGGGVAGGCLNGAFQSMPTANYRSRGVDALYTIHAGRTQIGFGVGYSNRRYYSTSVGSVYSLDGVTDQSIYAQMFVNRQLSPHSGIAGNVFGSYFESGIAGSSAVFGGGANATYYRNWGRLGFNLSAGLFAFGEPNGGTSNVQAQASVGMRYQF